MKLIGLIGGTSWESTSVYYALLNRAVAAADGPLAQPPILLHSVNFAEIARLQAAGEWDTLAQLYATIAAELQQAGAGVLGICANTMHLVADAVIAAAPDTTLVHIVDATAAAALAAGFRRVALLGTAYTMEQPFYRERLQQHGLDVVVPSEESRAALQRIVYEELTQGIVRSESRDEFLAIVAECARAGADVALLACTEFQMLAEPGDSAASIPLIDTTREHCAALLAAARA